MLKSKVRVARALWDHGAWATRELARRGWPRNLVHFYGDTPGDDLMCTAILRELRERGERGIWMMTRFAALFERNEDVDEVVPFDHRYERLISWMRGRDLYAHYGGHDQVNDRSPVPVRHIIGLMLQACGITGPVRLRPYLHLSEEELAGGRRATRQLALHSSGLSAHNAMRNKEWLPERLQQVVHELRATHTVVQLGAIRDPPLDGCIDLRGKTSMRESAAIIANSETFIGQVGFLMHLARAVDTRAVIIYGGREMPWQSGYSANTNLARELPCSPCWRWSACDNPVERECMRLITVADVVEAVHATIARRGEPLHVDSDHIPAGPAHPATPA
ncbi:MAG: glycosyltransferase family 9 protein [Gemmatimonadota bacterium]